MGHYRAKISMTKSEVIFEINEDLELYDAKEFAHDSVERFLETHAPSLDEEPEILIKISGKSYKYPLQ